MPNIVRRGVRALPFLVPAASAGRTVLSAAALLAVLVLTCVICTALWSGDKDRRETALDVLDRLLRWKGRR